MSTVRPKLAFAADSEASRLGSAVHQALAALLRQHEADLTAIAHAFAVDPDALAPLFHMGRHIWDQYADSLTVLDIERALEADGPTPDLLLRGTADIIAWAHTEPGEPLVLWDWKSGRLEGDYWPQLYGYAWLALAAYPQADAVRVAVAWIRERVLDVQDVTRPGLAAWTARIERALDGYRENCYGPDEETCAFCPRRLECPGRQQLVRRTARDWLSRAQTAGAVAKPEELARLYPQAKMLEAALRQYDAALRVALEDVGPLNTGDGRVLELVEMERTEVLLAPGWDILAEAVGGEAKLIELCKVNKSDVTKAVRAEAPRGEKAHVEGEMMTRLEKAGALERTSYTRLSHRKEEGSADDR